MTTALTAASTRWFMAAVVISLVVTGLAPVQACGLEPVINGGFTVSHPRSIDVAVAVAKARNAGLLPAATSKPVANDEKLRVLVADLQRLQARLNTGSRSGTVDSAGQFSLVLVGPGLWSHFNSTPDAVFARYHVDGPMEGRAVVVTHAAVLEALLFGKLSIEQAMAEGLLEFSGDESDDVRLVFASSFTSAA